MQKRVDELSEISANMLSLEDAKKALDEAGIYEIINPFAKEPFQSFRDASKELGKSLAQVFVEYGLSKSYAEKEQFMKDMQELDLQMDDLVLGKHAFGKYAAILLNVCL